MPRAPSITVCNIALSEIRASSIVTIDDNTPESNACATHYDDCLQLLLEAHEWGFATVRTTLAALSVNDRPERWLFAYEQPADMANASALIWPPGALWLNPVYAPYYPWGDGCRNDYRTLPYPFTSFEIADGVIYSNVEGALIQYVTRDIEEGAMPSMFKRALALDLASRLALALLNDRAMKGDLIQQAEAAKRRAIAEDLTEDLNRQPHRDHSFDETARVRHSF